MNNRPLLLIKDCFMNKLIQKIGYQFKDPDKLKTALTHSSFSNENRAAKVSNNERLEFLGDSMLGMLVACHLFTDYPDLPEGKMTRIRAELVCEQNLVRVATELGLGKYLMLGRGEALSGGRQRQSILADCVEAVIAAIYLDGGMDPADRFIRTYIISDLNDEDLLTNSDYKTILQELVQQKTGQLISYQLIDESGPDHMKLFTSQASVNDVPVGQGKGRTKKEAEQAAAKHALEVMSQ